MPRQSRGERLEKAEAAARNRIVLERKRLAAIQAQQKAEALRATKQRRYEVGVLADQAGLLACNDTLLHDLFALLQYIAQTPSPGDTLQTVWWAIGDSPGTPVDGYAQATPGV